MARKQARSAISTRGELRRRPQDILWRAIANSADAVVGLDAEGCIIAWNAGAERLFGYQPGQVLGRPFGSLISPDPEEEAPNREAAQLQSLNLTENCSQIWWARTHTGHLVPAEITFSQAHDAEGKVAGGVVILRDSSKCPAVARAEQQRAHELAILYLVFTTINRAPNLESALAEVLRQILPVLHLDSGKIYLLEPPSQELTLVAAEGDSSLLDPSETGITPGECLCGLAVQLGEAIWARDVVNDSRVVRQGCRQPGGYICAAVPVLSKERVWGVMHVARRQDTAFSEGEMALLRSVGAQIGVAVENMRLREEAQRAEALATLVQEMHHRIKNNLQTVADLLSLEMSANTNPAARKSLADSISRIKSIAAVHELLSAEHLRLTDITELARQVCDISLRHLVRPGQQVRAEVQGPAIYLPSKQATALALVMNELISNALEHAFDGDGRPGYLSITLAQDGPQVTVSVADNGRGLPPDFELNHNRGLGLQIVRTLVEKDLAGTLRLEARPEGGSRATLTFYK